MLQSIDTWLFRLINQSLANPFLDWFLNIFNGGLLFKQLAIVAGIVFAWFGGTRARICLLFVILSVAIGDGVVCSFIKNSIKRERPFLQFQDARLITGKGESASMPSSHAANSAAVVIVLGIFYRRTRWLGATVVALVCLARVYSGVHFPSDVFAGVLLAAIYTPLIVFGGQRLWRACVSEKSVSWLKLGWVIIAATLLLRLLYLAGSKIELSEDEAYQWLWSKHLALSYYSKPPLIAYTQFLGTHIFGDTEFGIRFLSPIFAAIGAAVLLWLIAKNFNERAAFFTVAALCVTPLPAVGATLMTIDALSVLFWTLAFVGCWNAVKRDCTRFWVLTGMAICAGILAKYVALFEWISILLFLSLCAREQFRRPGVYVAIFISLLGLLPVIIWNQQNGWITITHLSERSGLDQQWEFRTRFINDFVLQEFVLLNPVFFVLMIWALVRFWKSRTRLQTFLFCMGGPLFIGYFLYTLRARVQPNWIAPSILPLFALAATYWEPRWNVALKRALIFGFSLGAIVVVLLHDTNLVTKVFGVRLPAEKDPLWRVRAWSDLATVVEAERVKLSESTAKPAFIIGTHYGVTSLITFYDRAAQGSVYAVASKVPHNQFYFWPNYLGRVGENAIFVAREESEEKIPEELRAQFESIEDLGPREISYRGRVFHQIHLFACKNLLPQTASRR